MLHVQAHSQGGSCEALDACFSGMAGNDRMETKRDTWQCELVLRSAPTPANGEVVNLLKERFPSLSEALLADVAMSPTVIGADQKSVLNITDGAAAT